MGLFSRKPSKEEKIEALAEDIYDCNTNMNESRNPIQQLVALAHNEEKDPEKKQKMLQETREWAQKKATEIVEEEEKNKPWWKL
jgi:uncharacterized protein YpuA (DUF1002 family)